jgi:hypothetical protein
MKSLFTFFGPLMFLCGIVLLLLERVPLLAHFIGGENAGGAERGVIAVVITILSFAIMTISKSHSEIEKKLDALAEMTGFFNRQEKRLDTANLETNILRSLVRIYHQATPNRIHLLAGIKVLQEMHRLNVQGNFRRMEEFGDNRSGQVFLEDRSLAFLFLREILELLPTGGVWFGVTHLTNRKVWRGRELSDEFNDYRARMWDRASKREITVFRIYYFSSRDDFRQMQDTLDSEQENNVIVKYIVGGSNHPPDMSLLWMPVSTAGQTKLDPEKVNSHLSVASMHSEGLSPVCGIEFEVRSNEQLNKVFVNDPDSEGFKSLLRKFVDAWERDDCKFWPEQGKDQQQGPGPSAPPHRAARRDGVTNEESADGLAGVHDDVRDNLSG